MSEGERISNHPGYRVIWRTVLKTQIKQLVEQLSYYGGEEAILLSASLNEGTLSHIGSESGEVFLSTHDQVKKQFLGFCLNRLKKQKPQRDKTTEGHRRDICESGKDRTVTIGDKTAEGFTHDRTVTVINAAHTQTSAEREKNQRTKSCQDEIKEEHKQDIGKTSKDRTVNIVDATHIETSAEHEKNQTTKSCQDEIKEKHKQDRGKTSKDWTVNIINATHTETSAEHEKHQTAIIDGTNYIKEEHSYIAEKESSTSSIEDLDVISERGINSDVEMLDDENKLMNSTEKLDGTTRETNLMDIQKKSSTCVHAAEVSDEEDSDNADCEFMEMTCDEIATEFAGCESTENKVDKLGETLVIVKDEPDSDVSVGEPQEGVPGTSKDSTHDPGEKAAVGVYSYGKIKWANLDLSEEYSRGPEGSVKHKSSNETQATKHHTIWDLEEKYLRKPKPRIHQRLHQKTLAEKYHAIMEVEQGKKRKVDIAREYNVPPNTLSTWLKCKDKIKSSYLNDEYIPSRKVIKVRHFDVDRAMLDWVRGAKSHSIQVSSTLLIEKANKFARDLGYSEEEFTCKSSWVDRFKERHGLYIKNKQIHYKAGSKDEKGESTVDTD